MRKIQRCYRCGSDNYKMLFAQKRKDPYWQLVNKHNPIIQMTWVSCTNCGLTYRIEQLEPDEVGILYKRYRDVTLKEESAEQYYDRIISIPSDRSENYHRSVEFRSLISRFISSNKKVHLDIGTGAGVFIHTFRTVCPGWTSYAVEATPEFAEVCESKLGMTVYKGFYKGGLFKRKFTLITILQVLEHCHDPLKTLTDIATDLDEHGIVIIEVPSKENIGYIPFEHDLYNIPHVYLFSKEDLEEMVEKAGMYVLESRSFTQLTRKTYQIRVVAQLKK
jgi:hypothetical protein